MRLSVGQQIGNYTLDYRLGQGGMAEVWAATHRILGVKVALKVLFTGNPSLQQRLLREGRAQATLNHPNILPVRDVVDVDGVPGLILPLIKGPSLDKLLQTYRPTVDEAVALFRAIVEGVGHAHKRGLIHRDLKPGNVLLEERHGRIAPRIADFGLVKGEKEDNTTRAGTVMGTLNYAAPEQLLDASSVDHRADLFSLGVIFVELLSGTIPFRGRSLRTLLSAYETGPEVSGVPEALTPLCLNLLSYAPDHRLADCAAIRSTLNAAHPPRPGMVLGLMSGLARAMRERHVDTTSEPVTETTSVARLASVSGTFTDSLLDNAALLPGQDTLPRNNLPAELDAFIGREAALRTLQESLEQSRLVSILGTAGTGKTRLALQFARRHLSTYPGGVFFCDLSEANSIDGIVFVLSQAMEVPLGRGDHLKQLGHAIAGHGQCLLIFDNFEQLVGHAAQTLGRWLKRSTTARFVVTSRALLEIDGEYPLRLAPLSEAESVELFVERAAKKKRSFTLTNTNRDAVHQLVRMLDGLPLAIELATARIKVMKPSMILTRMNQRFKLLATGKRNTTQRQATLKAAIDWSWNLLEDWEQAAFAQCAIFEDGFTLEAAEAVLDLDDFENAPWAMDAVQSLVDKSLLVLLGENRRGEQRFGMLMSILEYAREKIARPDNDTIESVQHRHLSFYARFGREEARSALLGFDGASRFWALSAELDNLMAAHRFAVKTNQGEDAAFTALALFDIARRKQPAVALPPLLYTADPHNLTLPARLRSQVLGALAILHGQQGQLALAEEKLTAALHIAKEVNDRGREGVWLGNLGILRWQQGQRTLAEEKLTAALHIAKEVSDRGREGLWLGCLGNLHNQQGQQELAREKYTAALHIAKEVGNRRAESTWLGQLGHLHDQQGQLALAEEEYTAALVIAKEVGNRRSEGVWLGNLGNLHDQQGQQELAREKYTAALHIAKEVGDRRSEGVFLGALGMLLVLGDDVETGLTCLREGEARLREINDPLQLGRLLCDRAHAENLAHHPEAAINALHEARQIADDLQVHPDSALARQIAAVHITLNEDLSSPKA